MNQPKEKEIPLTPEQYKELERAMQCSGKSETLGVVSLKEEDTLLLKMNDYGIAPTF